MCWFVVLAIIVSAGLRCWTFYGVFVSGAGHFRECWFEVLDILACVRLKCWKF